MAKASLMTVNNQPAHSNQKEFMLLANEDVKKLPKCGIKGTLSFDESDEPDINEPVGYGSVALVKTTTSMLTYLLFPDNEWTLI